MSTAPVVGVSASPVATSNLFICDFTNQQHFAYIGLDGNIDDAWYNGANSSWNFQKINLGGVTNGVAAAGSLFVCTYADQQHFAYLDAVGNIQDAWYDGAKSKWNLQKINNGGLTAGPAAAGSLFVCVYNNQQHFAYIDHSGNIQDAWWDGANNRWNLQKINNGGVTTGPPAAGHLFVCTFNNQQHFAYLDAAGNIQDAWYDGPNNRWSLQKINNGGLTTGPAALDSLFVCVFGNQQHFAYRDASGNIQDAWYNGANNRWSLQKINNGGLTAGPSAAGSLFVSVFNNQQHFAYLDSAGNVQDCWYDGANNHWNLQKINNSGVTAGPKASSNLFVCVYNNQQHFSYLGTTGVVWDAWYDGVTSRWNLQEINSGIGYLGFVEQLQLQTEWCWAATSTSVAHYYNSASPWTQCTVANKAQGQTTCCQNGASSACNVPWYLDQALTIVGHFASEIGGQPSLSQLISEIDAKRPFGIRLGWNGGGGHFVIIDGYDNTDPANPTIEVKDPIYQTSTQDFNTFPSTYQGGASWTNTYFTN